MSVASKDRFIDVLEDFVEEKGFKNYAITWNAGAKEGTNFLGEVLRARVEGKLDGKDEVVNFVLKLIPEGDWHREMNIAIVFEREVEVYEKIFPLFDSLQEHLEKKDKFNHPIVHKCRTEIYKEVIIMDDLAKENYGYCALGKELNFEHAAMVLEKIAYFHALSFAAKDKKPEEYRRLAGKGWIDHFFSGENGAPGRGIYLENMEHAITHLEDPQSIAAVKKLITEIPKTIETLLNHKLLEPYTVVVHADLWVNNILFKYENDKLLDVTILDYQTIRIFSPVLDVFFFLFTSVNDDVRSTNLKKFLTLYYEALRRKIELLGCDPSVLFPEDIYRDHIKRFSNVYLSSLLMMLPIFTNTITKIEPEKNGVPGITSDLYKNRLKSSLKDYLNHGFLN